MLCSTSSSLLRMVVLNINNAKNCEISVVVRYYCCPCRDFAQKSRDPEEARLAQLGGRRSSKREVAGSNPGRTNTQGLLKITEKKVLPL